MGRVSLAALVVSGLILRAPAVAEPPALHDAVITVKVKSKLAARHLATLTNIKVDADNDGVVRLSGKAPTQDASDLAATIAMNTDGVDAVYNAIVISP